jgi:hypothetical protein
VLVARYEAETRSQLDRIRTVMEDWLRTQGVTVGS